MRPRAFVLAVSVMLVSGAVLDQERAESSAGLPSATPEVRLLEVKGVINPSSARYLTRELRVAQEAGAELVVVRLDTPGGLDSSMREIIQAMLGSTVPVVVYVSPSGARAASAGMFITQAAHVAAMAPGTNIGAAHPVQLGGGESNEVVGEKVVNDAAALARSLAETRGRNARWAERAVRESVSITAEEARAEDVIDLMAGDLDSLLGELDGRRVETASGEATLRTAGAQVVRRSMSLPEQIIHAITDPNIAYVLFTLGLIGIAAELYSPGLLFPGIIGALCVILALVAFGSLPLNWAGLLLLAIGIALVVIELLTEGFGFLGVGGAIAFLLGSLMLYRPLKPVSPAMPALRVSGWLVATMAAALAAFLLLVGRALLRSQRVAVVTGAQGLVGRSGVAASELEPTGAVKLEGETWTATAEGEPIHAGEKVRVISVEGVTLHVVKEPRPAST